MLWTIGSLHHLAAVGLAAVVLAAGHAAKASGYPQVGDELGRLCARAASTIKSGGGQISNGLKQGANAVENDAAKVDVTAGEKT
jgi:hypothetical protein